MEGNLLTLAGIDGEIYTYSETCCKNEPKSFLHGYLIGTFKSNYRMCVSQLMVCPALGQFL